MSTLAEIDYPSLPVMKGLFITGTDTDVGKTVIAGGIVRHLLDLGIHTEVFKPVASGCRKTAAGLVSDDAEFLAAASDSNLPLHDINPITFFHALAPNIAASLAGKTIDLDLIFSAYQALEDRCSTVIVEGVGGLLCPITDDFWVIHFAMMTRLPMIIVARPDLGTINHTMLTIHAARSAGIYVAGVVINNYQADPVDKTGSPVDEDSRIAMATNPDLIARLGNVPVLALVPRDDETNVSDVKLGQSVMSAIKTVDWKKIIGI